MPWFSKKSKFVKRFESHSKSRTIKAYLHFFLMKKTDLKMSSIMIRARIKQAHGFVICVCLIDGTLFLWPLHPLWTQKIISQGKVTMRLKICLFVIILQRLFGLRWDGLAVYTTIGYGQTVMFICQRKSISATRSIFLVIQHSLHHQSWFVLSKRATIPTWVKIRNNSTLSWQKCGLRAKIV